MKISGICDKKGLGFISLWSLLMFWESSHDIYDIYPKKFRLQNEVSKMPNLSEITETTRPEPGSMR